MNLLEALSRKLKNDWTGGASGDPGRYHAPGAFEDFRIADLFNNDRWTREPMVDPNSSSGFLMNRDGITPRYTNYYNPRGGASAAPANAASTAARGSTINDLLVRGKFRHHPVDPVETQFDPTPLHVDPPDPESWWDQGSELAGKAYDYVKGGIGDLGDFVSDLKQPKPVTDKAALEQWLDAQRNAGVSNPKDFSEYTGDSDEPIEFATLGGVLPHMLKSIPGNFMQKIQYLKSLGVLNPATSVPITSTLSPETRATEALEYKHLPADTQQLLFMQDAGIGRKYPVDYRELGIRRNDLSRSWRGGGVTPGNWGGGG